MDFSYILLSFVVNYVLSGKIWQVQFKSASVNVLTNTMSVVTMIGGDGDDDDGHLSVQWWLYPPGHEAVAPVRSVQAWVRQQLLNIRVGMIK